MGICAENFQNLGGKKRTVYTMNLGYKNAELMLQLQLSMLCQRTTAYSIYYA